MRSQSLFNFLTKAADVQITPAGTSIVTGADAERRMQEAAQETPAAQPVVEGHKSKPAPRLARRDINGRVDSSVQSTQETPKSTPSPRLARRDRNGRVGPTVFKGGYAVNTNDDNVDWALQGDGHINIHGAKFTDEQYAAYNNVRSSLMTAMRQQEGLSPVEARERATRLANQWAADRAQVAAGGKAFNRWQHVDEPAPQEVPAKPAADPATPTQQQLAQGTPTAMGIALNEAPTIEPSESPATEQNSLTSAAPVQAQDNRPLTLGGVPSFTETDTSSPSDMLGGDAHPWWQAPVTPKPEQGSQPVSQAESTPQPTQTPAPQQGSQPVVPAPQPPAPAPQPKAAKPEAEASAYDFKTRALANRNKVSDGLTRVNGYDGIYYKPGDTSGTLYKNNGEPWRNSDGQIVNAEMLRKDTNWFGASGNDIKHNIEQRYQEDSNRAFSAEELAALGFRPVPGAPGYYINSKGEIVDEFGNAEESGTLVSDVEHSLWNDIGKSWREWSPDPFGVLWSGSRKDYK